MAANRFKLAVNNADIPFTSAMAARAAVNAGLDSAPRTPRVFMGADDSADYNLAQVVYGENIMPMGHGVTSIGFVDVATAHGSEQFDSIFPLRDENENAVLFSPAHGNNFVYDPVTDTWTGEDIPTIWSLTPDTDPAASRVTYAYVDGKTFVCYSRLKNGTTDMSIMQWDSVTKTLVPSTTVIINLPFGVGEIDGISSSSGYLIIWSGLTVAWAFYDGAEFDYQLYTNGNYTGSGYQIPEDVQGPINAIIGISGGFLIFTSRNCVSANYHAQTISSPWVFKEVPDAGGLDSYEQATVEGSLGKVMAYTSAGIQTITINSAEHAHPKLSDFITQRKVERYDFDTHLLVPGTLDSDCYVKLTAVGNRYVVVSYGFYPNLYSYALIYDVALQRWGKIRLLHRDCFAHTYQTEAGGITYAALLDVTYEALGSTSYEGLTVPTTSVVPAQRALAFMTAGGGIKLASWAYKDTVDPAVVILGRIQLGRSKDTQLNRVEVEGLQQGNVYIQASNNGRTIAGVWDTVAVEQTEDYHAAGCLVDCKNFNIVIEGTFDISTVICEALPSGDF